jgi:prepilin-type N-terminal cleavage/methylation domain-containing protein
MLNKVKNRKQEGFTIIEVLIVLAIAGLILLIVFLAVPALQRNARNTQRVQDVARVLGAAQEVLNNNNGQMAALTGVVGTTNIQAAVGTTLAYYQQANVTVGVTGTSAAVVNTDTVTIHTGAVCSAANGSTASTNTRQLVALFAVETGNGVASRCQAS